MSVDVHTDIGKLRICESSEGAITTTGGLVVDDYQPVTLAAFEGLLLCTRCGCLLADDSASRWRHDEFHDSLAYREQHEDD